MSASCPRNSDTYLGNRDEASVNGVWFECPYGLNIEPLLLWSMGCNPVQTQSMWPSMETAKEVKPSWRCLFIDVWI